MLVGPCKILNLMVVFEFNLFGSNCIIGLCLGQGIGIKGRETVLVWHEKASRTALQTSYLLLTHTLLVQTHTHDVSAPWSWSINILVHNGWTFIIKVENRKNQLRLSLSESTRSRIKLTERELKLALGRGAAMAQVCWSMYRVTNKGWDFRDDLFLFLSSLHCCSTLWVVYIAAVHSE